MDNWKTRDSASLNRKKCKRNLNWKLICDMRDSQQNPWSCYLVKHDWDIIIFLAVNNNNSKSPIFPEKKYVCPRLSDKGLNGPAVNRIGHSFKKLRFTWNYVNTLSDREEKQLARKLKGWEKESESLPHTLIFLSPYLCDPTS